jgi:hypothetical protein
MLRSGSVATHVHIHFDGLVPILVDVFRTLEVIVSNQDELDARVALLTELATATQTAVDGVQQAIDDLKTANADVDFSGLDAAVAQLSAATVDLQSSDPDAPGIDP